MLEEHSNFQTIFDFRSSVRTALLKLFYSAHRDIITQN